ncbi:purine nucleoside phosphorylase-like [Acanthaster planci]|uniref:Purine nucleoside phosphorylase n=1 Tax=Acanthaster planci TaxID=133434 RepID=A0A8B7Z5M3_ACAPL|nr:purine nucleoside phosphorylase-like [Acanthaster planci]
MATTPNGMPMYTYSELEGFAKLIQDRSPHIPTVGIICGTGLGGLADVLEDKTTIPYTDIPHFPVSTVKGHHGQFVLGRLKGKTVMCMKGRFHLYEGYPMWKITAPVRVMNLLGVKTLFITNAAGGMNRSYNVGDIMIMKDHLFIPGLAGLNPLVGPNMQQFGERFISTSHLYDAGLRKLARDIGKEIGCSDFLQEGVYAMVGGPSFESPAELKLLNTFADVVGMSTCPEAIVAKHCDMRVFGLSLVTNKCVMDYDLTEEDGPNHGEVLETGKLREEILQELVTKVVERMENY